MSSELERRVKAIERKLIAAKPCPRHPPASLLMLDPEDAAIDAMIESLDECEFCYVVRFGSPRIVIIHGPRGQ